MTGAHVLTLVVTAARDPRRRAALAGLVAGSAVRFVSRVSAPVDAGALVVDGAAALDGLAAEDAIEWVRRGGRMLLLGSPPPDDGWRELAGVAAGDALPRAEYVLCPNGDRLTARVDDEILIVDVVRPLESRGAQTLLQTNVGARDVGVVTHHRVGAGSVTVAALGATAVSLRAVALKTVLSRALQPSPPEADRSLGVGVIGYGPYGAMGFRHGTASNATTGLRFAAVADADPRRRAAVGGDFPDAAVHADATSLLADDSVDVVVIATPPASHATLAARALRAGRHVVVEKPLCLTAPDADELLALAAAGDRMLTVHQNRRWDPDFVALRNVVDRGLLGDVFNVETFVGGFEHPCRAWHSDVSVSGGAVYDWGSHHLDWMLLLLGGFPATVQTTAHKRVWHDVTNADQLRVRLRWQDGREAEFVDSMLAAVRRPKFYVQGTRGTLVGHYRPLQTERVDPREGYVRTDHHHAEAPAELLLARHDPGLGISETRLALPPPQCHPFHRNVADHLLLGEPLEVTPEQARSIVILLEAAHRSGESGGDERSVAM